MSRKSNPVFVILFLICMLGGAVAVYLYYGVEIYIPPSKTDETRFRIIKSGPLALAIALYHTHTNRYPASLDELKDKPRDAEIAEKWKGPYVQSKDELLDAWRRPLRYASPGRHNKDGYDLWSVGPDGQDGTADDIGNW